ncbi:HNH endonuclease signature motif containing protein [Saccharopolyspora sp. WRP15-2]|uniref:HNH endonuclease signature motif containing protein n=1 Tax=Saccharopolyspora oryzae TaxID=2997343 RepID=A0ABT4UXX4_9PSEU|nr:HNH endonuclease signature motif containing protein [Saccharopolyspora oryzae]MDA3625989.1 HNH endonuclease signature motif containing protein [Saccharopolyspora oryzae]
MADEGEMRFARRRVRVILILDRVTVEDITADQVRRAVSEHDELGLPEFCRRYNFDLGRDYVITEDGREYGTKVILAAAHGLLPGREPLLPHQVGDDETVNGVLQREGFEVKKLGPPSWTREELVLACSLLFKNGRKALRATDQQSIELSALLQRMPFHAKEKRGHKFRSPSSVQRKLNDLMTSLPSYKKAKTRAGKLDRVVLQEFLDDEDAMHAEAAEIAERALPEEQAEAHAALESSDEPEVPAGSKAWAMFSAEQRKYSGNTGYDDVLGVQYVYDSKVPNYRRIKVGDLAVIRDDAEVHGVGRIHRIEQRDGVTKSQLVCPDCESGKFDVRAKRRPKYRCRTETCKREFDEPKERLVEVTQFAAFYGGFWRPLDGAIASDELKATFLDGADQNAIRSVDPGKLQAMLSDLSVKLPPVPPRNGTSRRNPPRGGHRPATTKARNGQGTFRKELLKTYGASCAVTGPCPVEVLQAAHIKRFAEHETHELDEGVLLRADVHLLFDNGLLAVDPESWRVVLAPSLKDFPAYAELADAEFVRGPSPEVVGDHFAVVTESWF